MDTAQISKIKAKGKPRGKPIAKGQILNPGGRPKLTEEEIDLIAACKSKTPAALDVIVSIMHDGQNEKNRLLAAQSIIERAYGKPEQPVKTELSGKVVFGWLV